MSYYESAFTKAVKKLKAPSSAFFSEMEWCEAFNKYDVTEEDAALLEAAKWINNEVNLVEVFRPSELSELSPTWSTLLAVAACNREYRTASENAQRQVEENYSENSLVSLDTLAAQPISLSGGQKATIAGVAEIVTDQAENWLFDAAKSIGSKGDHEDNLADIAVRALQFYNYRKTLNNLWNEIWFEGKILERDASGVATWIPIDKEYENLKFAWRARMEANAVSAPITFQADIWPKLKPVQRRRSARVRHVESIRKANGRSEPVVSVCSYLGRVMPPFMYDKCLLGCSYIEGFVESEFPNYPEFTVIKILEAWHTIRDIAEIQNSEVSLPSGSVSPDEVMALALTVDRGLIVGSLVKTMNVSEDLASDIVSFLTFNLQASPGNKGLWGAPLVEIPNSNLFALTLPVLQTGNILRAAEAWLEKGGVNDSNPVMRRGEHYEDLYRQDIDKAIARNVLFKTAINAPKGVGITKDFDEQIDLLCKFGSLCLVGELKWFLMPASSHEYNRYEKKLCDAARQVKRKFNKVRNNLKIIESTLGLSEKEIDDLNIFPVVITNQGFGFSKLYEDVLVVDARFLQTYIGCSGVIDTDMALYKGRNKKISTKLYSDEYGASKNFVKYMRSPEVLNKFLRRIHWIRNTFPSVSEPKGCGIMVPQLGNVFGNDRKIAEEIAASLIR